LGVGEGTGSYGLAPSEQAALGSSTRIDAKRKPLEHVKRNARQRARRASPVFQRVERLVRWSDEIETPLGAIPEIYASPISSVSGAAGARQA
jgi:hypothetical protein